MRPTRIEWPVGACLLLAVCWTAGCGSDEEDVPPEEKYVYHEVEEIVVNFRLPGATVPRTLTLKLQVELLADDQSEAVEAITKRWTPIESAIRVHLIGHPLANTHDKKFLVALRKDLAKKMNDELDKPYVQRVLLRECYFQ